jgi:hypothetical protein
MTTPTIEAAAHADALRREIADLEQRQRELAAERARREHDGVRDERLAGEKLVAGGKLDTLTRELETSARQLTIVAAAERALQRRLTETRLALFYARRGEVQAELDQLDAEQDATLADVARHCEAMLTAARGMLALRDRSQALFDTRQFERERCGENPGVSDVRRRHQGLPFHPDQFEYLLGSIRSSLTAARPDKWIGWAPPQSVADPAPEGHEEPAGVVAAAEAVAAKASGALALAGAAVRRSRVPRGPLEPNDRGDGEWTVSA